MTEPTGSLGHIIWIPGKTEGEPVGAAVTPIIIQIDAADIVRELAEIKAALKDIADMIRLSVEGEDHA